MTGHASAVSSSSPAMQKLSSWLSDGMPRPETRLAMLGVLFRKENREIGAPAAGPDASRYLADAVTVLGQRRHLIVSAGGPSSQRAWRYLMLQLAVRAMQLHDNQAAATNSRGDCAPSEWQRGRVQAILTAARALSSGESRLRHFPDIESRQEERRLVERILTAVPGIVQLLSSLEELAELMVWRVKAAVSEKKGSSSRQGGGGGSGGSKRGGGPSSSRRGSGDGGSTVAGSASGPPLGRPISRLEQNAAIDWLDGTNVMEVMCRRTLLLMAAGSRLQATSAAAGPVLRSPGLKPSGGLLSGNGGRAPEKGKDGGDRGLRWMYNLAWVHANAGLPQDTAPLMKAMVGQAQVLLPLLDDTALVALCSPLSQLSLAAGARSSADAELVAAVAVEVLARADHMSLKRLAEAAGRLADIALAAELDSKRAVSSGGDTAYDQRGPDGNRIDSRTTGKGAGAASPAAAAAAAAGRTASHVATPAKSWLARLDDAAGAVASLFFDGIGGGDKAATKAAGLGARDGSDGMVSPSGPAEKQLALLALSRQLLIAASVRASKVADWASSEKDPFSRHPMIGLVGRLQKLGISDGAALDPLISAVRDAMPGMSSAAAAEAAHNMSGFLNVGAEVAGASVETNGLQQQGDRSRGSQRCQNPTVQALVSELCMAALRDLSLLRPLHLFRLLLAFPATGHAAAEVQPAMHPATKLTPGLVEWFSKDAGASPAATLPLPLSGHPPSALDAAEALSACSRLKLRDAGLLTALKRCLISRQWVDQLGPDRLLRVLDDLVCLPSHQPDPLLLHSVSGALLYKLGSGAGPHTLNDSIQKTARVTARRMQQLSSGALLLHSLGHQGAHIYQQV